MSCQSRTAAALISSWKALTWSGGASGCSAPVQTSTLAFTLPEAAGVLVARTPWKLTTALRSAPPREFQRHRAAAAKADRAHPARIDLRQRGERRQRGPAAGAQRFRFVAEFANQFGCLRQIACLPAI